jgi:molybdopterin-guanine dinucleotide biosynthesis protein B
MTKSIPILSVVGRSGSGKTTLLVRLIRELKQRGHRLAVIKHHYHPDLEFDLPGKDSFRFAEAGAAHVVIAGPTKVVHVRQCTSEPTLADVVAPIHDVDLIVTEGYKRADTPKIEVRREQAHRQGRGEVVGTEADLVSDPSQLIALVSDRRFDLAVPQFGLDDVAAIADFIEARFLRYA